MHNESNEISTQVAITDVSQYLREALESPYNYALRLYITDTQEQASFTVVKTYSSEPARIVLTATQSEQLWSYVVESQRELEDLYDVQIEIRGLSSDVRRDLSITKDTRMSAASLVAKKSLTQETYDFLETAYRAGISIFIEGATGSGRTRFLNTLVDSVKDHKPTLLVSSFPEMFFGFEHSEIAEIRSDQPSHLLPLLLSMNQPRMVVDDVYISESLMPEINKKAKSGTQFIVTGYRNSSGVLSPENDYLASTYEEHPFELRVHVKSVWNCYENRVDFSVLSVEQIIQQKVGNRIESTNRMLFSTFGKVAEPTRHLRRKMESSAQKIDTIAASNSSLLDTDEVAAFVSITPEEKKRLAEYRNALLRHFETQDPSLHKKFQEIDKILAKF